jgi:hypothetical protein
MPANKPQPLPAKPAAAEPTVVTTAMLTRPLRRPKG